ncbi:hypothetical protein ACA910_006336 [Epithemia clementina (nom. ined.)]
MRLSDFVEDSSPLSSRADGKGSRGEGPHWEWGSLFGRDEESKFLQSLVQRKQQQPFLHQKNKRQPFKKSNSSASSSSHAKEGNARSESFLQYPGLIVLMHGAAGSGKSSLVKSQQWNEQYGWLFASGKFLANQKTFQEPFSALIEACNELIDFWMKHNDFADINQLKDLLDEEVELLRYVLPRVYHVVSKACAAADSTLKLNSETTNDVIPFSGQEEKPLQPPDRVAARNSSRARKRNSSFTTMKRDVGTIDFVNASFIRILSFLCQVQPVVLFMDDVQWADAASAKVLKNLATRTARQVDNLLLILAYREEEMPTNSCMQETLHAIQENAQKHQPHNNDLPVQESQVLKRRIYDMPITNLTVDSVNALIASLTKRTVDETMPLAQVVHKKTAGNPFFVTQFLQMLRSDHFLRYSYTTDQWEWGDVERLHCAAHLSDNVADIVAANIERLPYSTRVALQVAACLGKIIPQNVLVQWFDKYYEEASAWVGGAADSQMLHQVRLAEMQSILDHAVHNVGILIRPKGQDAYMWAHDKLQAVAYSLIPSSYRPTLHLSLGRLLWQMSQEEYPDEEWMVFIAANQMNRYSLLQQQQNLESEKDGATEALGAEVADLCHEAAWLSLAKSALYPAHEMLKASIMHLNVPDKWANHYDLCLSLYSTVAELSAQLGRYEETMEAVEQVKAHARSFDHKFRVQIVHLKLITGGQDRNFQLGWETSVEYLKERGVRMPKKLLPGMLASEFNKLRRRLPGGKIDGLIGLPDLTDRHSRNTIKMLVMNGFYSLTLNA